MDDDARVLIVLAVALSIIAFLLASWTSIEQQYQLRKESTPTCQCVQKK